MEYQFLEVAILHFLAVISPGPDFALISRQTLLYGRKTSIYTSIGIGVGILFHITYCIVGIEFISTSSILQKALTIFCSLYLCYLGMISILYSSSYIFNNQNDENHKKLQITNLQAFKTGLITNILNIKATLFFLSIYAYLGTDATLSIKVFYGLWMCIITSLWFVSLSMFFTNNFFIVLRNKYFRIINTMMGSLLIYIAIKIYLNSLK